MLRLQGDYCLKIRKTPRIVFHFVKKIGLDLKWSGFGPWLRLIKVEQFEFRPEFKWLLYCWNTVVKVFTICGKFSFHRFRCCPVCRLQFGHLKKISYLCLGLKNFNICVNVLLHLKKDKQFHICVKVWKKEKQLHICV